jgi:hypothetical protein
MPTLWFSYSLPGASLDVEEPLNSPYTIAWHVGRVLREKAIEIGYTFQYVNLDDTTPRTFELDDIAIGHCWWDGGFMHQALDANIKAKFILQPYSHGMVSPGDVGMVLDLFGKADHLFLITGEYWYLTLLNSPFAALYPKASRVDMAINPALHPYSKTRWNKPGERAICVIGNDIPVKGFRHVADLARVAGVRLGHFGSAQEGTFDHVPCMVKHGGMLFTPENIAKVCDNYDALVVIADADANPTVLLEAAAWGLQVYCNRNAGYLPDAPFRETRLDDMTFNVQRMRQLQQANEYDLATDSRSVRGVVERDYTFDKMCRTIWQKVSERL